MRYTIITVNYNNGQEIAKTIESVLNQTCTDYEYYIIDGLSTDNSVDIARSYIDKFAEKNVKYSVISEKDNGVYNAMNKGINLAQGDYINFMNTGDCFADNVLLEDIYTELDDCDALYGDTYLSHNNKIIGESYASTIDTIMRGIPFCHQSSFVKTAIAKEYKFNEKYKIQADYDMFLRVYLDDKVFKQIYKFISIFDESGVSHNNFYENSMIQENNGIPITHPSKLKKILRKFVPQFIIKWKHTRKRSSK